jgi:hypothetical protein
MASCIARAVLLQFGQSNRKWMTPLYGHSGRMGNYKGIEYTINMTEPGVWKYRFQIGRAIKIGTTRAKLELVAVQRVQKRIDRELNRGVLRIRVRHRQVGCPVPTCRAMR